MIFSFILWCLPIAMKVYAWRSPKLRALIAEKDFVAQIMIKDGSRGRWFRFIGGRIESGSGVIENPEHIVVASLDQFGANNQARLAGLNGPMRKYKQQKKDIDGGLTSG